MEAIGKKAKIKSKKLLVFDLDGTLADTKKDIADSLNFALSHHNLPTLAISTIESYVGNGVGVLIRKAAGASEDVELEELIDTFRLAYDERVLATTTLYSSVTETLELLSGKYKMAIVTNKPTRFSIPAIEGLGLSRFIDLSDVYCGDTLKVMKPAPCALEELSKKFGIVTSDMVMIGDSAVDIEFGKNGGATTIGATYGFRTLEELKAGEPDHLINSFDELLELLL